MTSDPPAPLLELLPGRRPRSGDVFDGDRGSEESADLGHSRRRSDPLLGSVVETVAVTPAIGGLATAGGALSILGFDYAAEVQTVRSPDDRPYDVLVHRDGVVLFRKGGFFNGVSFPAVALSLFRRWRRGPWRWAVTVRQSPFHGYPDLVQETFSDQADARRRAQTIAHQIEADTRPWPPEWEI